MSWIRTIVRRHLEAGRPGEAVEAALDVLRESRSHRERAAARKMLAWCAEQVPACCWSDAAREEAQRVGCPVERLSTRPGTMWFPAVAGERGRLVEVRVRRVPAAEEEILGAPRSPALRAVVLRSVELARAHAGQRDAVEVAFDGEDWEGPSAGLAIALATWSAYRGVSLDRAPVATGAVDGDGVVRDVGLRAQKLRVLTRLGPQVRVLVPGSWPASGPTEIPVEHFDAAIRHATGGPLDLDLAIEAVRSLALQGQVVEAGRRALDLLDEEGLEEDEPIELLGIAMKAATSACSAALQDRCLRALETVEGLALRHGAARLVGSAVVSRIDRLDLRAADRWLGALDPERLPPHERPHLYGPRAMVHTLRGEHEAALALRERSLAVASRSERPRCLGDLADACWRLGRLDRALEAITEALAQARSATRRAGYQTLTLAYLELHHARILAALGRPDPALAALDRGRPPPGIDPAYRYGLLRAEILGDPGIVHTVCARLTVDLEGSPALAALRWRTLSILGLEQGVFAAPCFEGITDPRQVWMRIPY